MEKLTKIYALILLVFCLALCVAPVMADLHIGNRPSISQINASLTISQTVNYGEYPSLSGFEGSNNYWGISQSDYNLLTSPATSSYTITSLFHIIGVWQNGPIIDVYRYNIIVNTEPTPEPTLSGAYITASVYNTGENNLYYDYNVRCMPAEGYLFAPLSFTPYSFIDGFGQRPSYTQTSEQTLIQVRVFAGGDVSMYSSALNAIDNSDYQHLSIVLTAPVYTAGDVVNNQTVHEELQNIPNPVTPSGGIVSGAWQPLALKQDLAVVNTPFSYIVDNYLHYFHFPEMATPETVKAELLNGTGNLTAPLYDTVDGLTSVFMIIPNYVSGVLTGLINPISETVILVKNVILTLSDYVYNAMSVLYVFIPFIYLFIPDVIWWGLTIYLSYLVFAWLLTLLFGYDVISVFYIDPFVSWVRNRRGGE